MTPGDLVWISLDCPSKYKGRRVKLLAWHNSGDGVLSIDPNTRILIGRDWLEPDDKQDTTVTIDEEEKIDVSKNLMVCYTNISSILDAVDRGYQMSSGRHAYIKDAMGSLCKAINRKGGLW